MTELMPRQRIIDLLERRVRALSMARRIDRGDVDASIILHWLGQTPCVLAMKGANEYIHAARLQMERIEAAARAWADLTNRSRVFHEIHYYFICWDAVWKRLKVIKKRAGFSSLKPILQKHHVEAEHYVFGRGQLEHYDEWLDGRPRYPSLAAWDAGNLHGSAYSLAGRQWDVSRASLERLERLVHEFADAVMVEGRQKLMAQEMNKA